ncbi:MAG: ROK family transcriptional regulator [Oscillospiraceae bacterium]|nr:ROK family transcriptional regulator [Oscillospiraceae bacterium]
MSRIGSTKRSNRSDVLSIIMARQPISRKQVAELLGISPAAVTNIVDELIQSGLVMEGDFGEASIRGGRRPIFLKIAAESGLVLSAVFRLHNARIAVCDLMGRVLSSQEYDQTFTDMEDLMTTMVPDMRDVIRQWGGQEKFWGAGISVPGTVENDRVRNSPELGIEDYDLAGVLGQELGIDICVDKDVYLSALGENWMGAGWDYSDFVVVTIGTGIGSAIIIDNQIYHGHRGMAGEVGYLVTGSDALTGGPYTMSEFGYFEKAASLRTLRQQTGLSFRQTVNQSAEDETLRQRLFQNADQICLGLASILSMLDPQAIILHGSYAAAEETVAEYIEKKLRYLTPVSCDIKFSRLGDQALTYGCVGTVWQKKCQMQFLPRH